jgi:hypothetical protein
VQDDVGMGVFARFRGGGVYLNHFRRDDALALCDSARVRSVHNNTQPLHTAARGIRFGLQIEVKFHDECRNLWILSNNYSCQKALFSVPKKDQNCGCGPGSRDTPHTAR